MKNTLALCGAGVSRACLDCCSSDGAEAAADSKRRDWHRMDECSLGQSAVAGYQSGLINGALRQKQMPPPTPHIVPINCLPPPSFTADLDEAAGGHRRPVGVAASPAIKVHLLAIFFSDKRQKK